MKTETYNFCQLPLHIIWLDASVLYKQCKNIPHQPTFPPPNFDSCILCIKAEPVFTDHDTMGNREGAADHSLITTPGV